ncbi:hypothetical protein [Roseiconus lacunae]|uniref:Uncharacterized protein n=1 Tax=Roseiconus lacunae TaxID=2605694 RepID=A0ABT7PQQ2_9BACT|nr:hypothetical protein [Roseiconus lacunae]MDM4018834.1 hypothetical protein [Roseiconus lacunae]
MVVFDDTHRERYQPGLEFAKERGFRVLSLEGLKPSGIRPNQTSILYRGGNCLDI